VLGQSMQCGTSPSCVVSRVAFDSIINFLTFLPRHQHYSNNQQCRFSITYEPLKLKLRVNLQRYQFVKMSSDIRSFFGGKTSTPIREKEKNKKEDDSKKKKRGSKENLICIVYVFALIASRKPQDHR